MFEKRLGRFIYPVFNETFYWHSGEIFKFIANFLQLLLLKIAFCYFFMGQAYGSQKYFIFRYPGLKTGATTLIEPMALQTPDTTGLFIFFHRQRIWRATVLRSGGT